MTPEGVRAFSERANLAFHGDVGALKVGRSRLSLDQLAEIIDGRGTGRVMYFGSCGTMAAPKRRTRRVRPDHEASGGFDPISGAGYPYLTLDDTELLSAIRAGNLVETEWRRTGTSSIRAVPPTIDPYVVGSGHAAGLRSSTAERSSRLG